MLHKPVGSLPPGLGWIASYQLIDSARGSRWAGVSLHRRSPPATSPRVTKEQNDPYIPSRRRRSEYSVLVLIARAGASLEGVTVGGDRSRF